MIHQHVRCNSSKWQCSKLVFPPSPGSIRIWFGSNLIKKSLARPPKVQIPITKFRRFFQKKLGLHSIKNLNFHSGEEIHLGLRTKPISHYFKGWLIYQYFNGALARTREKQKLIKKKEISNHLLCNGPKGPFLAKIWSKFSK